jgi:hypothetical protein
MCYMMNSSPAIVFRSLYRGGLRVGRVRNGSTAVDFTVEFEWFGGCEAVIRNYSKSLHP